MQINHATLKSPYSSLSSPLCGQIWFRQGNYTRALVLPDGWGNIIYLLLAFQMAAGGSVFSLHAVTDIVWPISAISLYYTEIILHMQVVHPCKPQ